MLRRLASLSVRHRRLVLVAWVLALVGTMAAAGAWGGDAATSGRLEGTDSDAAYQLYTEHFPDDPDGSALMVFEDSRGIDAAGPAIEDFLAEVRSIPGVFAVTSPLTDGQRSADGTVATAEVNFDVDAGADTVVAEIADAADGLRATGTEVDFSSFWFQEFVMPASEGFGLLAAVVILLIAFGSVVAMGLPLGTALIGLGTGLGIITVLESVISVPTVAPTLATMIGLGVGIDYALFIVTRHREHLHRGMTVEESAGRAIATAGQAVVFAGTTVVIAILGLAFVGISSVALMGCAIAVTVTVAVIAAITLLPALLGIIGHRIDKLRVPGVKLGMADDATTVAARWSRHVSRHPWPYALGSTALLVLLIVPFFSIRLGQTDAGNDPPGSTTRAAYDLLAEGFGPGFNGPLAIVVTKGEGPLADALPTVVDAIAADREVAAVAPNPMISEDGELALLTAFPKSAPQDAATQQLVHRLRGDVLPGAVERSGVGRTAVTGQTAFFIDISDKITSRLPIFIGSVLLMSFVLLMMVFRSVLVPLKAALMNLLGIGAAYGVLVAVFQWQWGGSLVGIEESLPIISFLPMFMFAILFGLSMDYEVFLMSRIREEYLHTGDNTLSVARGISHTARVITAAAIIMVSVFGSFAFGDDPTVKMFGIGLAVAIFLDATVIRMVLVPSTMQLLGDRNWWLPGWLDRLLPNLDLEGEGALPAPEYEPGRGPAPTTAAEVAGDDEPDPDLVGVG